MPAPKEKKIRRATIFLWGCLFFIFGIAAASFIPEKIIRRDIVFFIGIAIFLFLVFIFKNLKFKIMAGLLAILFFGIWRYSVSFPISHPGHLSFYNGHSTVFSGQIIKNQLTDKNKQRITLNTDKLLFTKDGYYRDIFVDGNAILSLPQYPRYEIGQTIQVDCQLEEPTAFEDFAYDRYLARYGVYSQCRYVKAKLIKGSGVSGSVIFEKTRQWARSILKMNLGSDGYGLAAGVLLGDTSGMNTETKAAFSGSGLTHLVAVSGMNISILSVLLLNFFLGIGLGRKASFYLSAAMLVLYVVLVGAPASAVRAGIMGILVLWASSIGRMARLDNLIFFTGVIMLLFNPRLLRDDIGFQLSFLAMLSFAYLMPIWEDIFDKRNIKNIFGIRDSLATTFSAQVFTWPVVAYHFSILPILSLPANLLVGPIQAFYMIFSIVSLFVCTISEKIGYMFFLVIDLISKYVVLVAGVFSSPTWSNITDFNIDPFQLLIYFLLLCFIILIIRKKIFDKGNFVL